MAIELSVFDPGSIQVALDRDLAGGLRALATALESGEIGGRLIGAEGVGSRAGDCDASVLVRLVVSAPVRRIRRVDDAAQLGSGDGMELMG